MSDPLTPDFESVYDVIIIGAGPCGLATAARLRESHPSALFTDAEQARYTWVSDHKGQTAIRSTKQPRNKHAVKHPQRAIDRFPSMLVLDGSGTQWMSRWKQLFRLLNISHLRSPMFFHPDPSDRDSLLAYAHLEGRNSELLEIGGCVGKEISKHKKKSRTKTQHKTTQPPLEINERDREDYYTPSTACFDDFCQSCQDRYRLNDERLVQHEKVLDIDFKEDSAFSPLKPLFKVRTSRRTYSARTVVLAIGAGDPIIPTPFSTPLPPTASHVMQTEGRTIVSKGLKEKIKAGTQTHALVVGGGLTSAQVVDCLLKAGVSKAWLLMRGTFKTKPFDVDLAWMSKFKNHQRSVFWTADSFEERLELVKEARNGGSITPRFTKLLRTYEKQGRLVVHTGTGVTAQHHDPTSGQWTIQCEPCIEESPRFDHVFFATGTRTDVRDIDFLQTMHSKFPIETVGGLPLLNDDLMWRNGVPLMCTGKLATLRLGPGAGNLEGARLGAERVSWAINDVLTGSDVEAGSVALEDRRCGEDRRRYALGIGNMFEQLEVN